VECELKKKGIVCESVVVYVQFARLMNVCLWMEQTAPQ
jgi:hypothetical protein